ncbi:uncharacterized protein [Rutidosis leptorrhynchoides]|uniref:uncharacterized protein n=1 Tax=Rutidosis leptorrhynchoides TaxID=125765 RepID=UPI003A9A50AF
MPIRSGAESHKLSDLLLLINQVSFSQVLDKWCCSFTTDGSFSVSGFRKLLDSAPMGMWPTHLCKVVPPKINFFIWRLRQNRLRDKSNLCDRGVVIPRVLCSSCDIQIEDAHHVFFRCIVADQVWVTIAGWLNIPLPKWQCFEDLWQWCMTFSSIPQKVIVTEVICYATLWTLWRYRNGVIFSPSKFKKCYIIDSIVLSAFEWLSSRYKKATISWTSWLQDPLLSL